jgi:hypothetical protein
MKKPSEFHFTNAATGGSAHTRGKRETANPVRRRKPVAPVASRKRRPCPPAKLHQPSGIRETEEARALLEKQLHSLYWWVFNACKMKGFIRAKGLAEAAERELDAGCEADSGKSRPRMSRSLSRSQ